MAEAPNLTMGGRYQLRLGPEKAGLLGCGILDLHSVVFHRLGACFQATA